MKRLIAALAYLILAGTTATADGANSNVNVDVTSEFLFADAITEVILNGAGGGTVNFFNLATAPDDPADAIALALAQLSLPPDQMLSVPVVTQTGTDTIFVELLSSNYNPVDDPAFVIGDPDDYSTWIAIGPEDVNLRVEQTTTEYTLFSVSADILSSPTPVPLPASGLLLLAALGGAGLLRRHGRA